MMGFAGKLNPSYSAHLKSDPRAAWSIRIRWRGPCTVKKTIV